LARRGRAHLKSGRSVRREERFNDPCIVALVVFHREEEQADGVEELSAAQQGLHHRPQDLVQLISRGRASRCSPDDTELPNRGFLTLLGDANDVVQAHVLVGCGNNQIISSRQMHQRQSSAAFLVELADGQQPGIAGELTG
jgi:hypothetical protein